MSSINWNAKGEERVLQNVSNIVNTIKGDIPFMRDFGVTDFTDTQLDKNKIISDTHDAIKTYENRAEVTSVKLKYSNASDIEREVKIEVLEE